MPRAFPPVEQEAKNNQHRHAPKTALSTSIIESVAGFSAGVVSCLAAHPLDLLKNRLQLNTQTRSQRGDSFRILRNVIKDEGGVKALYRGLWPNLLGNSLGWGLYFLFYGNLKALFQSRKKEGEYLGSAEFFSASIVAGNFIHHYSMLLYLTADNVCFRSPNRCLHKPHLGDKNAHARARRKPPLGLQINVLRPPPRLRNARPQRPMGRFHPILTRHTAWCCAVQYI